MWGWDQLGIKRRSGPTAADVLRIAQESLNGEREAMERRVQLAIAETTSRLKSVLQEKIEASEERHRTQRQDAGTLLEDMRNGILELIEPRVQLAINQSGSRAEERFSEVARESRALSQHVPAFLNAMVTVRALSFQLSSLRAAQEARKGDFERWGEMTSEIEALSRRVQAMSEATEREQASSLVALQERMSTTDRRNEQLAEFLVRFEGVLIGREGDYQTLRDRSDLMATELRELAAAAERSGSDLHAARERIETLQGQSDHSAGEVQWMRTSLTDSQADRANLWKAAEQTTSSIGELWHRVEFIRKEILYEMRFSAGMAGPNDAAAKRVSRIVDEDRVEAAKKAGDVRLNLGCGHIPLPDYLNVDFRDLPGVDVVADAGDLPFEPGTVSEITSQHVLEHFPEEHLRRLLPYWHSLLKPKGVFRAVVPDGEAMLAEQAKGAYSFEHFRSVLFGAQEYEGDFHFNMLTPDSLGKHLTEAGFREVSVPVKGRKNDISFEFEITAVAP
ncbi:hypothetical protein GCM10007887_38690 [Methylobacterium haplocladii]|uniref:Uncharacterized protein n=2 Tax=Methylobacterium haplocladii TaxID=1176176 RepID=A0A512IVX5_9HYPH|nr:hypothetical protein MHA02_42610 [Methylobacterium haplocladii]GJD86439.1 hypothetical protein HPGCJGGD_4346 [Methylobacterium haplocladii]GLS61172.1 hypothetical protein GCM10007887_38690 [Methylobacterium haplocladii]